jgi:hypothetical protein
MEELSRKAGPQLDRRLADDGALWTCKRPHILQLGSHTPGRQRALSGFRPGTVSETCGLE